MFLLCPLLSASPADVISLSLHDALPIFIDRVWIGPTTLGQVGFTAPAPAHALGGQAHEGPGLEFSGLAGGLGGADNDYRFAVRSEEHTSELQSRGHLVCRLLLEKKQLP